MRRSIQLATILAVTAVAFGLGAAAATAATDVNVNVNVPAPPGVTIRYDSGRPYYVEEGRRVYVSREQGLHEPGRHHKKGKRHHHHENGHRFDHHEHGGHRH